MPRLSQLPKDATPLWRWMHEHHVTLEQLAPMLKLSPNHVGEIRRGIVRPHDGIKAAIEKATKAWEIRKLNVSEGSAIGVPVISWFAAPEDPKPKRKTGSRGRPRPSSKPSN